MTSISRRSFTVGSLALGASALAARAVNAQTPAAEATPVANLPIVENTEEFNVLFIRHAESEVNVAPIPGVADDGVTYPLTSLGVQQAWALSQRLGNIDISAIYTSTRVRCIQTADAIALPHGLTLNLEPGIVETNFGDLATIDIEEVYGVMQAWATGDADAHSEGGESLNDMLARFLPPVSAAIEQYKDTPRTVVFVAHGAVLGGCLPQLFSNVSPAWAMQNGFQNTGIVSGAFRDGELVCTSWQGLAPQ